MRALARKSVSTNYCGRPDPDEKSKQKTACDSADGFVFTDYGIGTLDEFTELITQMQLGLLQGKPTVCLGTNQWGPVQALLSQLVDEGRMSPGDLSLFRISDDLEEVVSLMVQHCLRVTAS